MGARAAMTGAEPQPDAAQWLAALNHPLRRSILRIIAESDTASATEVSRLTDVRLGNVAYHFKVLTELDVLELVRRRQARGSFEKFYRSAPTDGDLGWVRVALERTRADDE